MDFSELQRVISNRWATTQQTRIRHSWWLIIVAFCLHVIVDPALTYLAVAHLDLAREANPFIRYWLTAGTVPFVLIHLPMYVFCGISLVIVRRLYRSATVREQVIMYRLSVVGFSGLILWGILLSLNALRVIWLGI